MYHPEKKFRPQNFEVIKDFGPNEDFFRLRTDGGEVKLKKLRFQIGKPLPDVLSCCIKGYNDGRPFLIHNMPKYVSEFYYDGFLRGEEFEFRVIAVPQENFNAYRLEDDNGLQFTLHETESALTEGQIVRCRFEYIESNFFVLKRSKSDVYLPSISIEELSAACGPGGFDARHLQRMIDLVTELAPAARDLHMGYPSWVITALKAVRCNLAHWFAEGAHTLRYSTIIRRLDCLHVHVLYLLQGSRFLKDVRGRERINMQNMLTSLLEQIETYREAAEILEAGKQVDFIDALLSNLKASGYIYHPNKQFAILMIIFRIFPGLVNKSLGNIFDTLMEWDLQIWLSEPFRAAFVEQLEIYVSDVRHDIDSLLQPETPEDNDTIVKAITAIAIQQSLTSKADRMDMRLNRSLFYRYVAMLRTVRADILLKKSLYALLDIPLPADFRWTDIKEPSMMITRASVDVSGTLSGHTPPRFFVADNIDIRVEPGMIAISRGADAMQVIPNNMFGWPDLQIRTNPVHGITPSKLRTIEGHNEMWNEIETSLFLPDPASVECNIIKHSPDSGDTVRILVDGVSTIPGGYKFECRIADDNYFEGSGTMYSDRVVSYRIRNAGESTFRFDDGRPMLFDAKVIGFDSEDKPVFSLIETTRSIVNDIADTSETYYCVITSDNGRDYSAISDKGFSLFVEKDSDRYPYANGTIIKAKVTEFRGDSIRATIADGPIDDYSFDTGSAFHHLMSFVAVNKDKTGGEDMSVSEDDIIRREDIREIIEILRFKAISVSSDILASFDYLSYARVLALVIGDTRIASAIKAHKDILLLHKYYAKNKRVETAAVDKARMLAPDNVFVSRLADRLNIVGLLNDLSASERLWKIVNGDGEDKLKDFARLVLSHNMLYESSPTDDALPKMKERIAQMLDVASEQRTLKYYGSESQYVEFKSSLVYPARKSRSVGNEPDPDRQEFEILHIIAGFMNTTGGTLYLGVSDDHYEHGLDEDFRFYSKDRSPKNTYHRRGIRNADNVANYLQNLIGDSFSIGKNAGAYAKAGVDDEAKKAVVYVKVSPCMHPVYLNNLIYVRHGSKTEPLTSQTDIDFFLRDRNMALHALSESLPAAAPTENQVKTSAGDAISPGSEAQDTPHPTETREVASVPARIATSTIRKNVIHEYLDPDNFVQPAAYIRFVAPDKYVVTDDEWSVDESDLLVIAVSQEETEDYLVMVYEGERIVRVPMSDVLAKDQNVPHTLYADAPLRFVSPAAAGSGLYSAHRNSKGNFFERLTMLDDIKARSMSAVPERFIEPECSDTPVVEIVPRKYVAGLSSINAASLRSTQLGVPIKGVGQRKVSVDEIKSGLAARLV